RRSRGLEGSAGAKEQHDAEQRRSALRSIFRVHGTAFPESAWLPSVIAAASGNRPEPEPASSSTTVEEPVQRQRSPEPHGIGAPWASVRNVPNECRAAQVPPPAHATCSPQRG